MPTKRDLIGAAMLIRDYCRANKCEDCPLARDLGDFVACELMFDCCYTPADWPDFKEGGTD